MSVSLEGRVALRELMEQAWQQVEGQAREMLKRAVEGLLVAERDRRVSEARQRGEKVYRWGYTVRKYAVGKPGAGARTAAAWAGRDRAGGTL
jgi:hypothetical protein